jgi:DNA-binding NarL/FixJ family response regulator
VKNGLLPDLSESDIQRTLVVCGDIASHRRLFNESDSKPTSPRIIRCFEDRETVLSILQQSRAAILVAHEAFISQLPVTAVLQLTNFGKGCNILVVLESEIMDRESVVKVLKLGCRGVLPRGFSSKLFKRAVLAILDGEIWAPKRILTELLCDLLRAASLKAENGLTPQEARILELSLQGYKNSAIADALFISLETVRWHKRRLNQKLRGQKDARYPQSKAEAATPQVAAG